MLTAFILICQLAALSGCDYTNAVGVFQVPPRAAAPGEPPEPPTTNPAMCGLHAQMWAAINLKLDSGYRVKILCVPPEKLPKNVG